MFILILWCLHVRCRKLYGLGMNFCRAFLTKYLFVIVRNALWDWWNDGICWTTIVSVYWNLAFAEYFKLAKVWFNSASYVHITAMKTLVRVVFIMLWPRRIRNFPAGLPYTVWYLPRSWRWQMLLLLISWDTIPSTWRFGVDIFRLVIVLVVVVGWMLCGVGPHR